MPNYFMRDLRRVIDVTQNFVQLD